MKHFTSTTFWESYESLPEEIKKLANKNFHLLKQNSSHPSLHLKKVKSFWSARIGSNYRSLAIEKNDDLIWFWIGSHSEYEKAIK